MTYPACTRARVSGYVTGTHFVNETLVWTVESVWSFCRLEKSFPLLGFKPRIFQLEPQSLYLLQYIYYR
jgi:hypothetical protein